MLEANERMLGAIGNTPIVHLTRLSPPGGAEVWAKWEGANPTGSMKDRMAVSMVRGAEARGELRPGGTIVEWTGGSTGSALAMVCAARGYRAHLITSDAFASAKVQTMRAFGATVEVVESDGGQITPALFDRLEERLAPYRERSNTYWTDQFRNPDNPAGYHALANEALDRLGHIDGFVMAAGTGGCFSGVAERLRAVDPATRCWLVEPEGCRNLSGGRLGRHRLEGIGVGFRPPGARIDLADAIKAVSDSAALEATRELARKEGLLAGISTGANLVAAVELARQLGPDQRVLTVLVDSGLKYVATSLYAESEQRH